MRSAEAARGRWCGVSDRPPARGRRVADVLADVASSGPRATWAATLVRLCRADLGAAGAGLAVADQDGPVGVAAATPGVGQLGEDLQFTLGEGPCRLAALTGRTVRALDLATDGRWVQYGREAVAAGICGAVSVPLMVGAVRVGVLDLYRDVPGPLTGAEESTLQAHAEAATAVLLLQREGDHEPGGGDVADLTELADIRPVVHQASGMVAIQAGIDLAAALLRLRAHAFSTGVPLREVAAAVVARRLRFDDDVPSTRDED